MIVAYEDPKEQLFYDSMEQQIEIAKNNMISDDARVKALNDLQTSYLAYIHAHMHGELVDAGVKTMKSLDQAKRLRDKTED